VRHDLLAEHLVRGDQGFDVGAQRKDRLQVGDGLVDLERLQGRVVPGIFVERRDGAIFDVAPFERDGAPALADKLAHCRGVAGRHHDHDDVTALG
jgi:hypothetical protein